LRYNVARYLESISLYQAEGNDNDDDFHIKSIDTCYTGTVKQNNQLIKALKSKKVQRVVSKR